MDYKKLVKELLDKLSSRQLENVYYYICGMLGLK